MPDREDNFVSEEGTHGPPKRPSRRVRDAQSAKQLHDDMWRRDYQSAVNRSKIEGQYDGNQPYDSKELERLGQSWRANVNFREAESVIDREVGTFWELLIGVPTLITPTISGLDPGDQINSTVYADVIAEEFTNTLFDWDGFFFNMVLQSDQMTKFGPSFIFFPDENDWRFQYTETGAVFVPRKSSSLLDDMKFVELMNEMDAGELWEKIEDPSGEHPDDEWQKIAEEEGWSVKNIKLALVKMWRDRTVSRTSQTPDSGKSVWEEVQERIRNNDIAASEIDFDDLRVAHQFVLETTGRITHQIIVIDIDLGNEADNDGFLFHSHERFERMEHTVIPILYALGAGRYYSVKGLGHRIYPHIELSNRFMCQIHDGASFSASLIMQPETDVDDMDLRVLKIGPVTIPPHGLRPINQTFAPRITDLMAVRNMNTQIMNNNRGHFRPRTEESGAPEKTAEQIRGEQRVEGVIDQRQVMIYYQQIDRLYREIFRRLTNPDYPEHAPNYESARAFVEKLKERGVPAEAYDPKNIRIRATRAIGMGSTVLAERISEQIVGLAPAFDEVGRRNAVRDRVVRLVGPFNANRYAPRANRDQIFTHEHKIAELENAHLFEGTRMTVSTDDSDAIHLQVHFRPLAETADLFQRQPDKMDPVMTLRLLDAMVPHVEAHIAQGERKSLVKRKMKQYSDAMPRITAVHRFFTNQVEQLVQERQRAGREAQQQVDDARKQAASEELRTKLAEINADFQIKLLDTQNQMRIREMKALHQIRIKDLMAGEQRRVNAQQRNGSPRPQPAANES